jgi:hypothetical protein
MNDERPSFFNDLPKVVAPADFEQEVLRRTVDLKKRTQRRVISAALIGTLLGIATMAIWNTGALQDAPFTAHRAPTVVPRTDLSVDAPLAHTVNLLDLPPVSVAAAIDPPTKSRPRPAEPLPRRRAARQPVAGY